MSKFTSRDWLRWTAWFLTACLFAVACVFLSQWQWSRRVQVVAQIQIVKNNFNANSVRISQLLAGTSSQSKLQYRPVLVSGKFLPEKYLLVRNRANSGSPGFELLVPFVSSDTWLVDLGWLPTGSKTDFPDQVPLPTGNPQTITARLYLPEKSTHRLAPSREIQEINLADAQAKAGVNLNQSWYLMLEHSAADPQLPAEVDPPSTDEGNHLSYAFQWIAFGVMALWFFIYALRKELAIAAGKSISKPKRVRRSELDKLAEDSAE